MSNDNNSYNIMYRIKVKNRCCLPVLSCIVKLEDCRISWCWCRCIIHSTMRWKTTGCTGGCVMGHVRNGHRSLAMWDVQWIDRRPVMILGGLTISVLVAENSKKWKSQRRSHVKETLIMVVKATALEILELMCDNYLLQGCTNDRH